jgi:sugar phosphate isomerase/epimerase
MTGRSAMFRFGVDSFIWIIAKAKELGFETLDLAIAHPEKFLTRQAKKAAADAGIGLVTTSTLNRDTNLISPDASVRARGVASRESRARSRSGSGRCRPCATRCAIAATWARGTSRCTSIAST